MIDIRRSTVEEIFDMSIRNLYIFDGVTQIKIGMSINVGERFTKVCRPSNRPSKSKRPTIYGSWTVIGCETFIAEREMHNALKEFLLGCEWFYCSPEYAESKIPEVISALQRQSRMNAESCARVSAFMKSHETNSAAKMHI